MLIGANGTGKSSIAGAIAIGLGGSPNVSYYRDSQTLYLLCDCHIFYRFWGVNQRYKAL